MRPAALVLLLAGCGSAPAESSDAIVVAVGSLDPVANIEVWVREVGETPGPPWRDLPFDVPRENFVIGEADFEALTIRVNVHAPGNYVVRLVGRGGVGVLEYTGCYSVAGVEEDDRVVLGRVAGNDDDSDTSPDDADAYCDMLTAEGAPCAGPEEDGACPPAYAFDCDPDDAAIHPLAEDECGNGVDEDCLGGDASCVDCSLPENQDLPECSGDCGVCNPPDQCCSGVCVDTTSSPGNCGACGISCASNERTDSCLDAVCVCGSADACGVRSACVAGECVCDDGVGDCDADRENGCETDLQFDSDHCGNCETTCKASCFDGACDS